jgi:transcriptional regulator with XRE-family HTH domain
MPMSLPSSVGPPTASMAAPAVSQIIMAAHLTAICGFGKRPISRVCSFSQPREPYSMARPTFSDEDTAIARRLRVLAEALGFSLSELAREINVHPNTFEGYVADSETRKPRQFDIHHAASLFYKFGVDPGWIILGKPDGNKVDLQRRIDQIEARGGPRRNRPRNGGGQAA